MPQSVEMYMCTWAQADYEYSCDSEKCFKTQG